MLMSGWNDLQVWGPNYYDEKQGRVRFTPAQSVESQHMTKREKKDIGSSRYAP
jgi:hypothetical protein